MDYMDQSVSCTKCGKETSSIITKICFSCERDEAQAKRQAEWDAKPDVEKAQIILESFANPQHMTFSKEKAAFVLRVFKSLIEKQNEKAPTV